MTGSPQDAAAERDRFRQLVESAPLAIAVLRGHDLVFEVVNDRFAQLFGGRDLLGLPQSTIDPDRDYQHEFLDVMATGQPLAAKERAVTYDWDGAGHLSTRYFDFSINPLRASGGAIEGVLLFAIDVTEQVVTRTKIEDAREQAETANRAKDEFLAMLGHELRNPLAPILTALQLMELRDPETFQRERTVIERQVRHVVRLVDDLFDVSRITRGKIVLQREPIDLVELVGKAIEQASPLLEQRQHQLTTDVRPGLVVDGDPVRLAQVISNLVTNAAKYTEPGGVIVIRAAREGDRIAIRVRDNGIGIAPELLPRVFDIFYQGRQAIDRAQGGLGLGLAIVQSLVKLHGGEVAVTSDGPGTGSEFAVMLPVLLPTAVRTALGTPLRGSPPLRRERVLVVDDNADALHTLADALEQRGYTTYRAHDAPSALALAAQRTFDVALLDIGLPVMDGYELGRRLRETAGLQAVKLVAVTGYGQASDLVRSHEAGFAAHLVKPISIEAVQTTIDTLIASARASEPAS